MSCPVYLINLPRDTRRLAVMQAQLDGLDLPFEIVPAVYGRELSEAERAALYDAKQNRARFHQAMAPGEIGCYASHLQVWQRLVDSGAPHALVLEDDAELRPELPAALRAVAALPPHWDMIKLIGREPESVQQRWSLPCKTGELIRYQRVPSLTCAYLVSRHGAEKMLRSRQPFFRPIDVDLRHWWEADLRIFGLTPYPVGLNEEGSTSSIGGREFGAWWSRRWRKGRTQWHYSRSNARANRVLLAQSDPFVELRPHTA
ncbi:glycosyltransferase family 25 protein [Paucibacter sp. O1-1]|nr:glycosyltransferase family 25 protein [Paucibacter sp. O1-1]MDA3827775.1 glycosyltransferase family 25 protein [Paucibacter sp. O1-1]